MSMYLLSSVLRKVNAPVRFNPPVKVLSPEGSKYKGNDGALYVILTNKTEDWKSRIIIFEIQHKIWGHYLEIQMNLKDNCGPCILNHLSHLVGDDTNSRY